jgi:hypothetical protein
MPILNLKNFVIQSPIFATEQPAQQEEDNKIEQTTVDQPKEEPKEEEPKEASAEEEKDTSTEANMEDTSDQDQKPSTPPSESTDQDQETEPQQENYNKVFISQDIYENYTHLSNNAIGLIEGYENALDYFHHTILPGLESSPQLTEPQPPYNPSPQSNQFQQALKKMFFIRTDSNEKDFTVYFQLSHDKIRDVFCHFFDTRLESHNVHILFGTAMSLKDNNPQQIWRLNSLISSMQLSRAASITAYALGWLDATETLLWCFAPNRHIAQNSYAVLTFDWNGFDYIASKKNIHKADQARFIERFKNLGLLNDEECYKYEQGEIITITADEVAERLKKNDKVD